MGKPTIKEVEEYMAALNIPEERFTQGLNGTAASDFNVISKPKHYMLFDEMEIKEIAFEGNGIEVRDVCGKLVCKVREGSNVPFWKDNNLFESDYVQLMQYLMRFMDKNGKEDLEKARWYLDKMISTY
jgi:DNA gyrase/topoisomerase IV subunit B